MNRDRDAELENDREREHKEPYISIIGVLIDVEAKQQTVKEGIAEIMYYMDSREQAVREEALKNVGMLRQWLNEDRITDHTKMVTNEDIIHWLTFSNTDKEFEKEEAFLACLEHTKNCDMCVENRKEQREKLDRREQEVRKEVVDEIKEKGMEIKYKSHNPPTNCYCDDCEFVQKLNALLSALTNTKNT